MTYTDLVNESYAIKDHMREFLFKKLRRYPNVEYKIKLPNNTYELIKFVPTYGEVKILKTGRDNWTYLMGYSIEFILDVCRQVASKQIIKNE